jgi:subtilisin family serine protease
MPFATGLAVVIAVLGVLGPAPALGATGAAPGSVVRDQEWWLTGLHVTQAWRQTDGAGIIVAVLGTGVAPDDPDLAGSVTTGPDYTGSGRVPGDPWWGIEGTAVAGIIAGHGEHGDWNLGIVGVAPAARILSVRVTLEFNDPLASDQALSQRLPDAIADGIRYAVDHGARVIDLPLDPGTLGLTDAGDPAAAGGSTAERAAVAAALAKDVVLVAPAGDDGQGSEIVNYPAAYRGVIAVGATDRAGQLASFSSARSHAALAAPGVDLEVATPPDGYDQISSTSTASGIVAGVAALILARFPRLTVAQVTQALIESTAATANGTSLPPLPASPAAGTGYGTVDAARAVAMAALIAAENQPRPPATRPVRVHKPVRRPVAAPQQPGTSALAGSVLRDAVAGVCLLIILLVAGLLFVRFRRERGPGAATGRAHARGQHEHRKPDAAAAAPPPAGPPAAATAAADYGAAVPGRAPPPRTVPPVTGGWRSPAGWQGGSIGEISYASTPPPRPAVARLPRTATGARTGRGAGSQGAPTGPPWEPAPEPERVIGPLPVVSFSSSPPELGPGIRIPGDMAGPRAAPTEPAPPPAFDLSAPPADFDVSAPAYGLRPPAFGVAGYVPPPSQEPSTSVPPDVPASVHPDLPTPAEADLPTPAEADLPATTQPELPAAAEQDRPAAAEPDRPAAAEPDRPAAAGPDLPTRQSVDFAAAPVPDDYAAPPAAEPVPHDYPPVAPSPGPSYIWDLAATDVFPAAPGSGPSPDKEIPSAPEDSSGADGS